MSGSEHVMERVLVHWRAALDRGDTDQAALCARALTGDRDALEAVLRAVAASQIERNDRD
jgi:hypothetical protein